MKLPPGIAADVGSVMRRDFDFESSWAGDEERLDFAEPSETI